MKLEAEKLLVSLLLLMSIAGWLRLNGFFKEDMCELGTPFFFFFVCIDMNTVFFQSYHSFFTMGDFAVMVD